MALSKESFLPNGQDCAECGSSDVALRTTEYRDHLYRYECEECGRLFTDTSGTFIEKANVGPPV